MQLQTVWYWDGRAVKFSTNEFDPNTGIVPHTDNIVGFGEAVFPPNLDGSQNTKLVAIMSYQDEDSDMVLFGVDDEGTIRIDSPLAKMRISSWDEFDEFGKFS